MLKTVKKLACVFCAAILLMSVAAFGASAAGSSVMSFSSNTINTGDSVTVKITVRTDGAKDMYGVTGTVNYDANMFDYVSSTVSANGGGGAVRFAPTATGVQSLTAEFTFKSKAGGSGIFSLTDCQYSNGNDIDVTGSSARVTVKDATVSANADLSKLSLSAGTLSPKFSAGVTSYTATVPHSVTKCSVYATAADSAAKVEVSGKAALSVGKNTRVITVTAPSGAQKKYTVEITRSEQEETVSSQPEDSTQSEPAQESGSITIGKKEYNIVPDLSGVAVLNGFNVGTADYNGTRVGVASDGTYTVYYLKSDESEQPQPFVKNGDEFEPLKYMTIGETVYIFTDKVSTENVPSGYYPSTAKLAGFSVKCYAFEDDKMSDFYIAECYSNGKYGFYRYDTIQDTLQREIDFKLTDKPAKQKDSFVTRFNLLPNGGKIIVVCMILTAAAIVALIVVFIIKTAGSKYSEYPEADEGYDDVFTDITDTDGYVFDSVTEDGEPQEIPQTENSEDETEENEETAEK